MGGRDLLGPADVPDETLLAMVGELLGRTPHALTDVEVEAVSYDRPAITTAARHRLHGTATYDDGDRPFSLFVKQVQEWSRSPYFAEVPEELRDRAAGMVPWRTEAAVYRSDLAVRLPDGLGMPRAVGVHDLDALSSAIWLEDLTTLPVAWDEERYRTAAYLLGRLAASPDVGPLAGVGGHEWSIATYLEGRVAAQVVPMLHDDRLWQHPLVAGAFDADLRTRLLAALDRLDTLGAELAAMPHLTGHGDACPDNLLAVDGRDDLVLIDFGFWNPLPVGFDLGQLLVGDVQVGQRRAAALGGLEAVDDLLVESYVAGLQAEGTDVAADLVRRAHALQVFVFTGISALPWEHLGTLVTEDLRALAADRAALVGFSLDRLEATG